MITRQKIEFGRTLMWTYDMIENYFHYLDKERMNTWRWTGSVIVNFSKRSRFPQFASNLKWKKEDRKEGEKEREIESEDEGDAGRVMVAQEIR